MQFHKFLGNENAAFPDAQFSFPNLLHFHKRHITKVTLVLPCSVALRNHNTDE